jgi:hypothetical protein
MKTIQLLDGSTASQQYLKEQARDDNFYYNHLGKVAFSSTILSKLLDSPKKYYYYQKYGSEENTSALSLGRIIHAKALTPELFNEEYEVIDVASKNTKAFKEAKTQTNKYLLTRTEDEQSNRVVDALLKNDTFVQMLANSQPEEPAVGNIMGYPFRAKADILKRPFLYDLKTTTDLKGFKYSAKKYNYDMQAFIYCTLFDVKYHDFKFVVIDKGSLDIGIAEVTEEMFDTGREKCREALDTYTNFFIDRTEEELQDQINNYIFDLKL